MDITTLNSQHWQCGYYILRGKLQKYNFHLSFFYLANVRINDNFNSLRGNFFEFQRSQLYFRFSMTEIPMYRVDMLTQTTQVRVSF